MVLMQKNQTQEALKFLEDASAALEKAPLKVCNLNRQTHKLNIWVNKALIYQQLGKQRESLTSIEEALKLSPDNTKLIELKGEILGKAIDKKAPTGPKSQTKGIIENHP